MSGPAQPITPYRRPARKHLAAARARSWRVDAAYRASIARLFQPAMECRVRRNRDDARPAALAEDREEAFREVHDAQTQAEDLGPTNARVHEEPHQGRSVFGLR